MEKQRLLENLMEAAQELLSDYQDYIPHELDDQIVKLRSAIDEYSNADQDEASTTGEK